MSMGPGWGYCGRCDERRIERELSDLAERREREAQEDDCTSEPGGES